MFIYESVSFHPVCYGRNIAVQQMGVQDVHRSE